MTGQSIGGNRATPRAGYFHRMQHSYEDGFH